MMGAKIRSRSIVLVLASMFSLTAPAADPFEQALQALPQVRFPAPNRVVSGAIDEAQVAELRGAGIRHVVNLRPAEENPSFDEARIVQEAGLAYHALPIEGARSLTLENARELDRILTEIGNDPTLLHCSSGNRVGALIAVREAWIKGRSGEEAIAIGEEWGLTRLEDSVRALLEEQP